MGLDMYLYAVGESGREPGFAITKQDSYNCEDEVLLPEVEYNALPEEYKKYFVKGTETSIVMLIHQALTDIFNGNEDIVDEVQKVGSRHTKNEICLYYRINKDSVKIEVPEEQRLLDDTKDVTVAYEFELDKDETYKLTLIYRENVEDGMQNYTGKYVAERVDEVYSCIMTEIEYQRKGLDDNGWAALPENCTYCADKSVVKALCKGGLSRKFLRSWVDGETLFYAWW